MHSNISCYRPFLNMALLHLIIICYLCQQSYSQDAPQIHPFHFSEKLKNGDRVNIICSITSGKKPLSFQWMKNNIIITEKENIEIFTHPEHSVLAINPINSNSSGNYSCVVSNKFGTTSYTAILEVPVPPIWKQEPQNIESIIGNNVTIACQANGYPPPTVTWTNKGNMDLQQ
ncbi:cell adhesion molecule Dscam2-like [Centruroides vittatus]|uniref:cell adhesion molecule Dscam2-like n=1 Tax=Centruroides vittatus TaxID=120091 RepID=UPI0035101718